MAVPPLVAGLDAVGPDRERDRRLRCRSAEGKRGVVPFELAGHLEAEEVPGSEAARAPLVIGGPVAPGLLRVHIQSPSSVVACRGCRGSAGQRRSSTRRRLSARRTAAERNVIAGWRSPVSVAWRSDGKLQGQNAPEWRAANAKVETTGSGASLLEKG